MISVRVDKFKNLEEALRIFRRKVRQANILELSNKKSRFQSRSEKRHKLRRKLNTYG